MSSFRSGVNTDEQIRNGVWSERMKESAKLGLLSAALLVGISLFAAESAPTISSSLSAIAIGSTSTR